MSTSDDSDQAGSPQAQLQFPRSRPDVGTLLFETLCYALIEKGVLTKNDALSVVQSVAEVRQGAIEKTRTDPQDATDLKLLRRLFTSFQALGDHSSENTVSGENIHQLRPPIHGDTPEFPEMD